MKRVIKAKPKRGAARDLFAELSEGIKALGDARQGRRTLLAHAVSSGAENSRTESVRNHSHAQ